MNQNDHQSENDSNKNDNEPGNGTNPGNIQPGKKVSHLKRFWKFFINPRFKIRIYPHIFKRIGFWIVMSMLAMIAVIFILAIGFDIPSPLPLIRPFPEVLFMSALWLITASEDKLEDEGVRLDRTKAYQFSYTVMVLILIFTLVQDQIFKDQTLVKIDLIAFTLLCTYLVTFNILKYKRNKRDKEDENLDKS